MNQRRTPIGVRLLAIFFAFGASMSVLTIVLLIFPGSAFDSLWRLNPDAQAAFQSLGAMSIFLMALVGTACGAAAVGLAKNRGWGRNVALIILAVNLVGDSINVVARHDLRTLIGIPIGGALIFYLLKVRTWERENSRN